jgi:hypothetical protein
MPAAWGTGERRAPAMHVSLRFGTYRACRCDARRGLVPGYARTVARLTHTAGFGIGRLVFAPSHLYCKHSAHPSRSGRISRIANGQSVVTVRYGALSPIGLGGG